MMNDCLWCDEGHGPCEAHDTKDGVVRRLRVVERERDEALRRLARVLNRHGHCGPALRGPNVDGDAEDLP